MATTALTLDEYGRAIGALIWLERRAFEVLGERARAEPDPARKLALAVESARHGEHAELLEPLVPATRDHDPEALVAAADTADAELDDPDAIVARLAAAHAALLTELTAVADAAAIHRLGLLAADHRGSDAMGARAVR